MKAVAISFSLGYVIQVVMNYALPSFVMCDICECCTGVGNAATFSSVELRSRRKIPFMFGTCVNRHDQYLCVWMICSMVLSSHPLSRADNR